MDDMLMDPYDVIRKCIRIKMDHDPRLQKWIIEEMDISQTTYRNFMLLKKIPTRRTRAKLERWLLL